MARLCYYLSGELHKKGLLEKLVVHSKGKYDTNFPSEPVSSFSRVYLLILNRLYRMFNIKTHKFRFAQELLYDWFCSMKLSSSTKILLSTQPYLKRTFRKAKKLGIKTILLPGTPEDNSIYNITTEENKKLNTNVIDGYTYKKRNNYYNESLKYVDLVIGFFPNVYRSYVESITYKGRIVDLPGHMPPDLSPVTIDKKDLDKNEFIIGYLAYTVALKGLQYLLEAWQDIMQDQKRTGLKLMIAGPILPAVAQYIDKNFKELEQVSYVGQVTDVAGFMKQTDLFVVPSLVDAGPASALEAAHYAVPVLITDNCGSAELIGKGEGGGYIVPIKDKNALKENIIWAYTNREANAAKGMQAKKNLDNYSFSEYISTLSEFLEKELND